jgi:hypothetical protein
VFKLTNPKTAIVPALELGEGAEVQTFAGWESYGDSQYVRVVLLYAVSLEGGLTYDPARFSEQYSRVFDLVSRDVFACILDGLFSHSFIEVYAEALEGGGRLNFFTVALFFEAIRAKGLVLEDSKVKHFVSKRKKNAGFLLSDDTADAFKRQLAEFQRRYQDELVPTETSENKALFESIYDEIVGYFGEGEENVCSKWQRQLGFHFLDYCQQNESWWLAQERHKKVQLLHAAYAQHSAKHTPYKEAAATNDGTRVAASPVTSVHSAQPDKEQAQAEARSAGAERVATSVLGKRPRPYVLPPGDDARARRRVEEFSSEEAAALTDPREIRAYDLLRMTGFLAGDVERR